MQSKLRPVFRSSRFDAVVIHLGDNDCCSVQLSPLCLASLLDDFAQRMVAEFGVRVVYVCQLFARPKPRRVSPEVYEQRQVKVNEFLETLLGTLIIILFYPLRHRHVFFDTAVLLKRFSSKFATVTIIVSCPRYTQRGNCSAGMNVALEIFALDMMHCLLECISYL